jgi:hypothetical protein
MRELSGLGCRWSEVSSPVVWTGLVARVGRISVWRLLSLLFYFVHCDSLYY